MLTQSDKKRFRAIAHKLHPVVTVATKGLSEGVIGELNRALEDHELIKIKIAGDRDERKATLADIVRTVDAEVIQQIGGVAVLYRAAVKQNPRLSNVLRTDIL